MLYKIVGRTADNKQWVRLFNSEHEPLTPIRNELTRHGYSSATEYPPKSMEFWVCAQTGIENKQQKWETCWYCKGERFVRTPNNRHMACPVCHMDGCLLGTTANKNLDKLIEGLNL